MPRGLTSRNCTSCSACGYGNGRSNTPSTTLKIAVDGANAQGKRKNRNEREGGPFAETTNTNANVFD
jgi:hypothetical protein